MESMTGYAHTESSTEQFSFSIEVKTLNSRYFESFVNLPKVLRSEENEITSFIKEFIQRGKIELNIEIFDWVDNRPVSINADLIRKYYRELQKVHDSLIIKEPLRFESILSLDGLTSRERSVLTQKSHDDIYRTLEATIKKTIEMRKKEGLAIKKDLTACMNEIAENAAQVKNLARAVMTDKRDQLQKRIESLMNGRIDDTRLYTEIAILADKLDINEEIVRLGDHLKKFKAVMKEKDQTGKKLDFVAQEMFREVNTIASKSNSSDISHLVVEMKNSIEKIREHCRNIA